MDVLQNKIIAVYAIFRPKFWSWFWTMFWTIAKFLGKCFYSCTKFINSRSIRVLNLVSKLWDRILENSEPENRIANPGTGTFLVPGTRVGLVYDFAQAKFSLERRQCVCADLNLDLPAQTHCLRWNFKKVFWKIKQYN